ncbi:MAG: hypothetical protein LQ350_002852 [Teloschistes chrysophthalmus]|nr:MAG: hypothetical protein LQ350_002852 [Niorma chrysophthalma]
MILAAIAADVALHEQQQILSPNTKPTASDSNIKDSDSPPPTPHILIYSNGTPTPIPTNLATLHASSLFRGGPSLGESLSLAKTKAQELNLSLVASDIETWIKHHPWKAAFYAASAIGFFAPEILSIPALEMLGFGLGGVRAGTLAAKIQSVIGPVAARSVFAIWQSARMGGYGVEYVNGGVRALVALADAAVAACNPLKDCKGLISDAGERSLGVSLAATGSVLSVVCGCLVGVYNFFG